MKEWSRASMRRLGSRSWIGFVGGLLALVSSTAPAHADGPWAVARPYGLYDPAAPTESRAADGRNVVVALNPGSVVAAQMGKAATTEPADWQFSIAPYLWAPQTNIKLGVGELSRSATIDFSEIVDHFDFGFTGHFEAHWREWTGFLDLMYLKLSKDDTASSLDFEQLFFEFGGTYRLASVSLGTESRLDFEALAGGRLMFVDADLSIGGQSASRSGTLVDPIVGGRITYHITDTVTIWFRGDVGGFGISSSQSNLTYNLVGGLDWRFAKIASAFAGWRYMHVDFDKGSGRRTLDATLSLNGPVLGINFYF